MNQTHPLLQPVPSAQAWVGMARCDITPPPGIYSRMWGAAKHDTSEGTHRALTATVLTIRAEADAPCWVLASLDLPLLGIGTEDPDLLLVSGGLRQELNVDLDRLIVHCAHTHGAPWPSLSRACFPGGHLLEPYLRQVGRMLLETTRQALAGAEPAILTFTTGRCTVAANRDLPDPAPHANRLVCGFNPLGPADDTLLVGRITRLASGSTLGTIVNYACHPTTLAWENKLISPDYLGALRQVVEAHAGGLCLFLQGASGELAPTHQYVADPAVADQHGRAIGFAALSALETMLPPGQRLAYQGVMESGAPLAVWRPEPFSPSRTLKGKLVRLPLPLRPQPSVQEIEQQIRAAAHDRVMHERLVRLLARRKQMGDGSQYAVPVWLWQWGDILLVGHANEAYSCFQQALRQAFPQQAVLVLNLANGTMTYLYPPEFGNVNVYQANISPFTPQALDMLTQRCRLELQEFVAAE